MRMRRYKFMVNKKFNYMWINILMAADFFNDPNDTMVMEWYE